LSGTPVRLTHALLLAAALLQLNAGGRTLSARQINRERVPAAAVSGTSGGKVVRLDPAVDAIVPPGAVLEKIADGFSLAEGPVWTRAGQLLVGDVRGNRIYSLTPGGEPMVFRDAAGYSATTPPLGILIGPNGITFDRAGHLIVCETGNRRVTSTSPDGRVTVLADRYDGKRLNSPNDVTVRSDGSIYFTDPPYGFPKQDDDPHKELPFNAVFRIHRGQVQVVTTEVAKPNGLSFSPDERLLYVTDSERNRLMRFDVASDGTAGPGIVLVDQSGEQGAGVMDGVKVDSNGNIYVAGVGGLWIVSPRGAPLARFEVSDIATNAGWGDDGSTLYVTGRAAVYRIRLTVKGARPCC
jgi:gluconolactonase